MYDDERQMENRQAERDAWEKIKDMDLDDVSQVEPIQNEVQPDTATTNFYNLAKSSFVSQNNVDRTGGTPTEPKLVVGKPINSNIRESKESQIESARMSKEEIRERVRKLKEQESDQSNSIESDGSTDLQSFPAEQYFLGFWRMVASPLPGNDVDVNIFDCDNLVLRVDGTVAGGPIFDQQQQLRAAGGTWRMFQAKYKGDDSQKEGEIQTRLRIELIVPPRKDRLLIMEGKVTRTSTGTDTSTIGAAMIGVNNNANSNILSCSGESYIENIEGVRQKLGIFSIRKLPSPEKVDYTISVAPPSGLQ